jgi:hypothetical protein
MSDDPLNAEIRNTKSPIVGATGTTPTNAVPTGGTRLFRDLYKVPTSETPEGKERLRYYYEALGEFIDMFARVESAMTSTLWAYAKTEPKYAKVLFSGVKIELGMTHIKQLAEVANAAEELKTDLVDVFQQLGIINGVRNDVLHYGANSIAEGTGIVSNAQKAKGEPRVFPISPAALYEMTEDLKKIAIHLRYRHLGQPAPLGDFGKKTLDKVLLRPWQYKYPGPPKGQTNTEASRHPKARGPRPPHQLQSFP